MLVIALDPLKDFNYEREQEQEDQNLRLAQRASILRP
jgi:hypothetical protein